MSSLSIRFRITRGRCIFPGEFFGLVWLDFRRLTQINLPFLMIYSHGDMSSLNRRRSNLYRSFLRVFVNSSSIAEMTCEALCVSKKFLPPLGLLFLLNPLGEIAEQSVLGIASNPPEDPCQRHCAPPNSGCAPSMGGKWMATLN